MSERAAGLPAARLAVAEAAGSEGLGPVLGQARDDLLEQRSELSPFAVRERGEQCAERLGAALDQPLDGSAPARREVERLRATVPSRSPFEEPLVHEALDHLGGSGLGDAEHVVERLRGLPGMGGQVDEGGGARSSPSERALDAGPHAVAGGQRRDSKEVHQTIVG